MISKTYTLYIDYLSIYADLSPALHQHTYAHTHRGWMALRTTEQGAAGAS